MNDGWFPFDDLDHGFDHDPEFPPTGNDVGKMPEKRGVRTIKRMTNPLPVFLPD